MKEALFYKKETNDTVCCLLCNHVCVLKNGQTGICGVRRNHDGVLYSLNYGRIVAAHVDPVEKKPLFHFLPGSTSYSIAAIGCNFKCGFCQNWQISQAHEAEKLGIRTKKISAQAVVEEAIGNNCQSISYTYTEPTVYFEFAYECAKAAKEKGIYNNFVTNGYMTEEALEYVSPYLDAANVDIKAFREDFYRNVCKATLKPVLDTVVSMKRRNVWVEITTLLIPGYNDSPQELKALAGFIASVDKNIPWHISRFHPDYKLVDGMGLTSLDALQKTYALGKEKGLKYIYIGNIITDNGENTYCPQCGKLLIKRSGFSVVDNHIEKGMCEYCGETIAGVWGGISV